MKEYYEKLIYEFIVKIRIYFCIFLFFICPTVFLAGQKPYVPSKANLEAREAFQNDKFGLFIHWGVYSILGDGEWVMQYQDIPVSEYEKLPDFFNPISFNAQEWVSMVKDAGMKYITITSKHHDGFAMYDSQVSDYNIVDKTPFGRDILRELEEECLRQGVKLYVYYSELDWHHPDYYPRGWTGRRTGRPESGDWEKYLQYQDAQVRELAENYQISGFWFDGWWDQSWDEASWLRSAKYRLQPNQIDWKLRRTYDMIHGINSALLIGNNHHVAPFEGEDFQMFEKDLPGKNTTGFGSSEDQIGQLPLESCQTINHSWGFNLQDGSNKSIQDLIQYLVKSAGYGANLLLNVGPMPNGKIQPDHKALLHQMGEWMKKYGETIYASRKGPIPPQDWGVTTTVDSQTFIHVLNPVDNMIFLPGMTTSGIKEIRYLDSNKKTDFSEINKGILVVLDPSQYKDYDTILEIIK